MKKLYLAAFALFLIFSSGVAHAGDIDYSRVINLSGKQRMLTQKMSKEAILVALNVDVEKNVRSLRGTRSLFDKTLKGLRNGDDELGLPPTKKPNILAALDDVDALWKEFSPAIDAVMDNGMKAIEEAKKPPEGEENGGETKKEIRVSVSDEQISVIASKNMPLLKAMNKCVKLYESTASSEDMNPALAVAINLSGRQRMLTQKMSKEFFLIAKGYEVEANRKNLKETIELFDKTLKGLIDGDTEQGLSPAPTDEIAAQLKKVQSMWDDFRPKLESEPTPETIKDVADNNLPLLKEMNKAVGMFESLGK